ncbi:MULTISPECIES: NnrU family protein [unclassified Novosphingobium]|uniref:NnrU family protein n=1 Tax=unclassified Novosphingobium TaxID=2644732 RepID=UPI000EE766A5|nr:MULTISPECIES: NnrU family protein [unclassified Novosphingobium]HCF25064.1 MFS transporter [Novosphingobium sp.]HQV02320.1 NnrU family protein [Novosphingobium sp.]
MDNALAGLIAACTAFVGSHFALSHPLRAPLARLTGEKAFPALYSLVAFATFGWLVMAFRAVPPAAPLWDGLAKGPWIIATLLMLLASVLLVGSFKGNPAMPAPGAAALAAKGPHGVFHSTRHPMMWSFALWSAAHVLVSPTPRVIVLSLAMAILALVGAHMQDRKKAVLMGPAWQGWQAQTCYWPRLGALGKAGTVPWLGGIALWLVATWAHGWLIAMPAGVWRWLG